jgi:hypothetical protein
MQMMLSPDFPPLPRRISYDDPVLLVGSCFTEHIYERLEQRRFRVMGNPHGILFNPLSVAHSVTRYLSGLPYEAQDLFYLNELWNSWDHHTRFSAPDQQQALEQINHSLEVAADFIRSARYVIITLGSAFQYYLKDQDRPVANNHRAPAQWFEKRLLETSHITDVMAEMLEQLFRENPSVEVLLTISPVRHIRDGVVDNNRSKARLVEAVHALCARYGRVHYFPAYELVIDVLRDYRFYDIDMVHPNYLATSFVWEQFVALCIEPAAQGVMKEVEDIMTARAHRPRFPDTEAHRKFLAAYAAKTADLLRRHPKLDLREALDYFNG